MGFICLTIQCQIPYYHLSAGELEGGTSCTGPHEGTALLAYCKARNVNPAEQYGVTSKRVSVKPLIL